MKRAFDPSVVRKILQHGIDRGLWTMEQLDCPPPGYKQLVEEMARHRVIELRKFKVPEYRNPLRDPEQHATVSVSDPRDFTPPTGATPAQAPELPLQEAPDLSPLSPEDLDW